MKKPGSKLGLSLSTLYMAYAIYAAAQAARCSAFLCYAVLIPPASPWIVFYGYLWSENRTPAQLLLFEVLLWLSFAVNAWIIYKIGKGVGSLFGGKRLP